MPKSIDERVVEMRFDNKDFESRIKTTMASLSKLKESLKFDKATEGLNRVKAAAKNFTMSSMEDSIEAVNVKFSAMQVVGATALANLTNSAVNSAKRIFSAMTNTVIQGGINRAKNLEQAKFQLQGLGVAWENIKEDIDYAVDGTAYGLDVAAKAASQLTASGVTLGTEMKAALRGISGVAAMTNSSYEDIATVFTTVAGNGRLMASELNRIGARGINAASALGEYLGKSEKEVREMTSQGKIDFQTFATAMDSAFGEHAKKANETFNGALANMKSALGRIGAEVASPALNNLRDIFNALRVVINNTKVALMPFIENLNKIQNAAAAAFVEFSNLGGLDNLISSIGNAFEALFSILRPIKDAFAEVFPVATAQSLVEFTVKLKEFTNDLKISAYMAENIKNTFKGVFAILNAVTTAVLKIVSVVGKTLYSVSRSVFGAIADIILTITGNIGLAIFKVKEFIDSLLALGSVRSLIGLFSSLLDGVLFVIRSVTTGIANVVNLMTNTAFSGVFVIFEKIGNAIYFVASQIDKLVMKVREFIIQRWVDPNTQAQIEKLRSAVSKLFDILEKVYHTLSKKLVKAFDVAKGKIKELVSRVRELFGEYIKIPTAQEAFNNVLEFFTNLVTNVSTTMDSIKEGIKTFVENVIEINKVNFDNIISNFNKLRSSVVATLDFGNKFETFKGFLKSFGKGIIGVFEDVGVTTENVKSSLGDLIDFIKNRISGITFGDVMAAGVGGALIVFLFNISKSVRMLSESISKVLGVVGKFGKVLGEIAGVLNSVQGYIDAKTWEIKIGMITGVIKAVALLAGAIAVLAAMDPERVRESAITIGVLAGALILLSSLSTHLSKTIKPDEVVKSTTSIIAVAGAITILSVALKILSTIDSEHLASGLLAMTVMIVELAAFMVVVDKFAKNSITISGSFIVMAAAIMTLAVALSRIGGINPSELAKAMGVLTLLMGMLTLMTVSMKHVDLKSALSLMAIVAALNMLVSSIKKLSSMNSGQLSSGLIGLIELMGVFYLLIASTKLAGKHAIEAGIFISAISAAMLLMAEAVQRIGMLDGALVDRAIASMAKISILFGILIASTKFAGEHAAKAGLSMLAISGAMILISGAMLIMSRIEPDKLDNATNAIMKIQAMFALLIASTRYATKAEKTITAIGLVLAGLAAVMFVASLMEPEQLVAASASISMIGVTLSLMIASTNLAKKAYPMIALMGAILAGLAIVIKMLVELPVESVLGVSISLSALILSLTASMVAISLVPPPIGIASKLVAMIAVMGTLGLLMVAVAGLNEMFPDLAEFVNSGAPLFEAFGNCIGSLLGGLVSGVINSITRTIPVFAQALSDFATNIQGFIDFARTIDQSALDGIVILTEMMVLMAAQDFINALSMPFKVQSISSMTAFFNALPAFATGLKSFTDSLGNTDIDKMRTAAEAAKMFAEIYSYLPEVNQDDNIDSLKEAVFGSKISLDEFGKQIKGFVDSLVEVNNVLVNEVGEIKIDPARFEAVRTAVGFLLEIQDLIGSSGGLLQIAVGRSDLGQFGLDIREFVLAINDANDAINNDLGNINESKWKQLKWVGTTCVELMKEVGSNAVGLGGLFTGWTELKIFAEDVRDFVGPMSEANSAVHDIGTVYTTNWSGVILVATSMAELNNELGNNIKGASGWFTGWTDLGIFAKNVGDFIINIEAPLRKLKEIPAVNTIKLDSIIALSKGLADIQSALGTNTDSVISWWAGRSDLGEFGNQISVFGEGLKGFHDAIGDTSFDNLGSVVEAGKKLAEMAKVISETGTEGGLIKLFTGEDVNFTTFSNHLQNFGQGLVNFQNTCSEITDFNAVNRAINIGYGLIDLLNKIESNKESIYSNLDALGAILTQLGVQLPDFYTNISNISDDGLGNIDKVLEATQKVVEFGNSITGLINSDLVNQFGEALKNVAVSGIDQFISGMSDNTNKALDELKKLVEEIVKTLEDEFKKKEETIKVLGKKIVEHITTGILNETPRVRIPMNNLVSACVNALNSDENFEKFEASGKYAVQGYARGFTRNMFIASNAARTVASAASSIIAKYNGEGSPAKLYEEHAMYNVLGYAQGYIKYGHIAERSAMDMAKKTAIALDSTIRNAASLAEDNLNFSPTITPVIDLTGAETQARSLNALFSGTQFLPIDNLMVRTAKAIPIQNGSDSVNTGDPVQAGPTIKFEQNNYSPKPLSRIDIYRDTKNQLSIARRSLSKL